GGARRAAICRPRLGPGSGKGGLRTGFRGGGPCGGAPEAVPLAVFEGELIRCEQGSLPVGGLRRIQEATPNGQAAVQVAARHIGVQRGGLQQFLPKVAHGFRQVGPSHIGDPVRFSTAMGNGEAHDGRAHDRAARAGAGAAAADAPQA
ncbi:unnamed protein product, partial [Ectocarpus sp. 12 AP-2014]